MTEDARFEDAGETPLRLRALDADDLRVISALLQDAVTQRSEMTWKTGPRRFACLVNRFRWEDAEAARKRGRDFERVRAMLVIEDVQSVRSHDLSEDDPVAALLAVAFLPGEEGSGRVVLTFAGGGVLEVAVEALEVTLTDVTRPYVAPSHRAPSH